MKATTLRTLVATLAAALVALGGLWAAAPGDQEDETIMAAKGKVTFRIYCSNCHGDEARGDGELAELLTVPPSDLTRIAERNGGVFDSDRIRALVDGRDTTRAHGRKDMPIWGDAFQKTLQPTWSQETDESRATRKIEEVVRFLEKLQVEGDQPAD